MSAVSLTNFISRGQLSHSHYHVKNSHDIVVNSREINFCEISKQLQQGNQRYKITTTEGKEDKDAWCSGEVMYISQGGAAAGDSDIC